MIIIFELLFFFYCNNSVWEFGWWRLHNRWTANVEAELQLWLIGLPLPCRDLYKPLHEKERGFAEMSVFPYRLDYRLANELSANCRQPNLHLLNKQLQVISVWF